MIRLSASPWGASVLVVREKWNYESVYRLTRIELGLPDSEFDVLTARPGNKFISKSKDLLPRRNDLLNQLRDDMYFLRLN